MHLRGAHMKKTYKVLVHIEECDEDIDHHQTIGVPDLVHECDTIDEASLVAGAILDGFTPTS